MADDVAGTAWRFWELLGAGRVDEATTLLDDDGTYWVNSFGARQDRPMSRMKEFFRLAIPAVPMVFTRHDALVSGDRVALEIESDADTERGRYNNRYCFIMTVRDGRIVRIREYVDTKHAAEILVPAIAEAMQAHGGADADREAIAHTLDEARP